MDLEKLFEDLDEKVFTDELKSSLTEEFTAAVTEAAELKALEISAVKIEEKICELEEASEEFKTILETESKEKEAQLLDQVDSYLEKVVEDFVIEASESLEESVKQEKADMIIEAMDAMIVATGVDISKIVEAKDSTDADLKLEESVVKYDTLIEENISLQKKNDELLQVGLINEMKEGMSLLESEKFDKLAKLVDFSADSLYVAKLDTIKESLQKTETISEKEIITEKVETVKESKTSVVASISHLI